MDMLPAEHYVSLPVNDSPNILAASREIYVQAQICTKCGQQKARNEAEFAIIRDERSPHGRYDEVCLVCRDYEAELAHQKVERKALTRILDAIEKRQSAPHVSQMLERMLYHLGGVDGVAAKTAETYESARSEGDHKVCARIIDIVTRLHVRVSESNQQLAISMLSPDELRVYMADLENRIINMAATNPLALMPSPEAGEASDG